MCLLLILTLASAAWAAPGIDTFYDVTDEFNRALERMVKEVKDGRDETVTIGTFNIGEYSFSDGRISNMSTIQSLSGSTLIFFMENWSVEGELSLGDMVIEGVVSGEDASTPKITVSENLWSYMITLDKDAKNCVSRVAVLATDIGGIMLTKNPNSGQEDITIWTKHNMTEEVRQKITDAIANVFLKYFNACKILNK